MLKIVIGGQVDKEKLAALVQKLGGSQVTVTVKSDLEAAMTVKTGQQDYYIDLEPYFYDPAHRVMDSGFSTDGLHPDVRGKMLMGEIINQNQDKLKR